MAVRKRQLNRSSRNVPFGSDAGEKRQYSWYGSKIMNILSWSVFIVCLLWGCGTIGFRLGEFVATKYYDEPIEVESPASEDEEMKAYSQLLKYPPPPPRRDITKRNTVQKWWGSAGP